MRNMIFALAATLAVAGCTTAEKTAVGGAAVGAAIGGIATGNLEGAAVGAAVGGVGGYLLGRAADRPGYCRYRDRYNGRVYVERC
ncbi:hypothetical protein GA830_02475 [Mesorhizobium sp. NBSH29]|uniref:glycine zipper domain-containing protein n=1 Tax=Mesorhizobium sp. NBSH29 TaxID=2654249 RepID=UPI001896A37C|nr:glycine zipper domain-containing protein [Mesorhizobium sp. NBSH29]QPC85722.1 hypothetical protein GA830_02475 [Mesorhizobium sp. NBSH29]